jgi:putative phosphoribosyl transferase
LNKQVFLSIIKVRQSTLFNADELSQFDQPSRTHAFLYNLIVVIKTMSIFTDRCDAGRKLARKLIEYKNQADTWLLALPRGGVPVAYQVAQILQLPLDVLIVRKLGVPCHKETAMGAIASGGVLLIDNLLVKNLNISQESLQQVIAEETRELNRRITLYQQKDLSSFQNKTLILIDDGLATGFTALAAIQALKKSHPKKIVFATPIGALTACAELQQHVDQVVCFYTPPLFYAVGQAYANFVQTTDEEVISLLQQARREKAHHA